MNSKTSTLTFQPAPRPQPRMRPEDAERLADATADLGFGRAISTPEREPAATKMPAASSHPRASMSSTPAAAAPGTLRSPTSPARMGSALKFDVPDKVWTALRQAALDRRVTVKYLVMEALADKGYEVDLASVPEDGRRLR